MKINQDVLECLAQGILHKANSLNESAYNISEMVASGSKDIGYIKQLVYMTDIWNHEIEEGYRFFKSHVINFPTIHNDQLDRPVWAAQEQYNKMITKWTSKLSTMNII